MNLLSLTFKSSSMCYLLESQRNSCKKISTEIDSKPFYEVILEIRLLNHKLSTVFHDMYRSFQENVLQFIYNVPYATWKLTYIQPEEINLL